MLKFILGIIVGISLTSIPLFITIKKKEQLELTFISCFEYKGMWVNGVLHLCEPKNVWIKQVGHN